MIEDVHSNNVENYYILCLYIAKAVFYWDQPFQAKPVLDDVVEVYQQNAFQLFSVGRIKNRPYSWG